MILAESVAEILKPRSTFGNTSLSKLLLYAYGSEVPCNKEETVTKRTRK